MARKKPTGVPSEIRFNDEPRGVTYSKIVEFALRYCKSFSLVWRDDLKVSKANSELALKLSPFVISDTYVHSWPGTKVSKSPVNVCTYVLNDESASLLNHVNGLYNWVSPKKPEDLAFYLESGEVWLGSVAHEYMGWLVTKSIMRTELKEILWFLYANGVIDKKYEV